MKQRTYKVFTKKKTKTVKHIDEFKGHKVLVYMTKVKSPNEVKIFEGPEDPWFIHPVKYRTKSGIVSEDFNCIKPDLESWIKTYEKEGFVVTKI